MSNHSPRVYLNTPQMQPIGTVLDSEGLQRLAVDARIAAPSTSSPTQDAFGRSRTSTPTSIFDSKQVYDDQPLLFVNHTESGGSVAYQAARSSCGLTVSMAANSRALRQTKRYLNYQPGKAQLIFATFNFNGAVENVKKRVGYFDNDNGVYVELGGTASAPVYSIAIRSSVGGSISTDSFSQADWNIDPLDGTGPSGFALDPTKVIILVIDLEWLGVGQVRVGFDFGGQVVYAHRFQHANQGTSVYMKTPNLPVRWEIFNEAASSGSSMEAICCSVQSEGGFDPLSIQRTASRNATPVGSVTTTPQSLFSIRLKSAYNRATVFPLNASCVTTDTGVNYFGQLILNPSFGTALTWGPVTNSPVESSATVTTVTGGTILAEFYGISGAPGKSGAASQTVSADINSILALASDYAGTSDIVTLAVRTLAGTSNNSFYAQMDWLELL
jgi:hypothetical protein